MSVSPGSNLQKLWEHYVHTEDHSYEKSCWLDLFLCELLATVKDGHDIRDALSFCSIGDISVSSLVATEFLSDVYQLCDSQGLGHPCANAALVSSGGSESYQLRRYLTRERGWRHLSVLHQLGVTELTNVRELIALLIALYPVVSSSDNQSEPISGNPYLKFCSDNDDDDDLDVAMHRKRKRRRKKRNNDLPQRSNEIVVDRDNVSEDSHSLRRRKKRQEPEITESASTDSDVPKPRSTSALKVCVNPMDFEYFSSVMRSDDESLPAKNRSQTSCEPSFLSPFNLRNQSWQDMVTPRIHSLQDTKLNASEGSLLFLQLLHQLVEQEVPAEEPKPAMLVLKFALDGLWALHFGGADQEDPRLEAAAAKLMLAGMERTLGQQTEDPTAAIVHNGMLPMILRILEDACGSPGKDTKSLHAREFIFASVRTVFTFLHHVLRQKVCPDKISDFLQLFQLFTDSQDGRLLEKIVLSILESPDDLDRNVDRAGKVVDMMEILMLALKRMRQELRHLGHCRRSKHRTCTGEDETPEIDDHHLDALGSPACEPKMVGSALVCLSKSSCALASLFSNLLILLKRSHDFPALLQIRLVKAMTNCGACCCFPARLLLLGTANFLKKADERSYVFAVALIEKTIFRELRDATSCGLCSLPSPIKSWKFVEIYRELLSLENAKLCHVILKHLLRITPEAEYSLRQELLFRLYYPTFLQSVDWFKNDKPEFATIKFLIQSCLTAISSLIVSPQTFDKFAETDALTKVYGLVDNPAFMKSSCLLLEVCVIMEMQKIEENDEDPYIGTITTAMFEFLETETENLLMALEGDVEPENEDNLVNYKSAFYKASGIWRAAAGIVLCTPRFRKIFAEHQIFERANKLCQLLAIAIATNKINGTKKFALRVMEAVMTCCLIASSPNKPSIVMLLKNSLLNKDVKLNSGMGFLVDIILQISILRASQEQIIPQHGRRRLSVLTMDLATEAECSSNQEYLTADDGYEADIEIQINNPHGASKMNSRANIGAMVEESIGNNSLPMCNLTIDLLIHLSKQCKDVEIKAIVVNGFRKLESICKENPLTCTKLADTGAIKKILTGFRDILTSQQIQNKTLHQPILDVFTTLAMKSISPAELVIYLSFFKVPSPPLLSLLNPLHELTLMAKPRPNFLLTFPVAVDGTLLAKECKEEMKNVEKAENLVNNFRSGHLASEICSPWSVHAICLPIGPEMSWPVWLMGCSVSVWLKVEKNPRINSPSSPKNVPKMCDSSSTAPEEENDSFSDWDVLTDNWSREVASGSPFPPAPAKILHLVSIGFESLVFEMWLDLQLDKLMLRLTRPDDKSNRTISETSVNGVIPSGQWHHMAVNFKDTILNKHSAVVQVSVWIDGWKEITAQLPFDGLLIRKPGTTCVLVGQVGASNVGRWDLSNLMIFRCPVFNSERALYLASLGPNHTNIADCLISSVKPDFATLIASGALQKISSNYGEFRKSSDDKKDDSPESSMANLTEIKVTNSKINWTSVMEASNSYLSELQDNLLLNYDTQNSSIVHLYPQGVASSSVHKLIPGQSTYRISTPEHRISQQPPISLQPITFANIQCQQYKGLVPSALLIGGMPNFLYLFARVVELHSSEQEQALALSMVLQLARSNSEMLNQYRLEGGTCLLLKVLESPRCHAGKHILKVVIDAACDGPALQLEGNLQEKCGDAIITNPELIKGAIQLWRTWASYEAFNLLLQTILSLLKDTHAHREFNATQLNRVAIVDTVLVMCKEYFMFEEYKSSIDSSTASAVVDLVRALMGVPPEFSHLVIITDFLVLVHQASETYVTHARRNMYFLLSSLEETTSHSSKQNDFASSSSNESISTLETAKLNKALTNVQIQQGDIQRDLDSENTSNDTSSSSQGQDTSAGEDSGIAASDGSNQTRPKIIMPQKNANWSSDKKRSCQGLVCEGLLLLLRDSLRILPEGSVVPVLKHVLRAEVLLVLSNSPDPRVRTALIKVILMYLQRASDEEVNRFIKQKYFVHMANQVSLYPGSEALVVTVENLALRVPGLSAMPVVLAMIPRAAASDVNVAKPLVSFVMDIIGKNSSVIKNLLEQGLIECLAQTLINCSHINSMAALLRDVHVLLIAVATRLLDSPGNQFMTSLIDLHVILILVELKERTWCGSDKNCIIVTRDAQVALFDGELDVLTPKVSAPGGFRLRSTSSYLASTSYLSTPSTTSGDSDESQAQSPFGNLSANNASTPLSKPGKSEFNERYRMILNRAVDFIVTSDQVPSVGELQLAKRLFSILLLGMSSPQNKPLHNWMQNTWFLKTPVLKKNTAKIMVWLLSPHQSNATRVYAVHSLMEEPITQAILSSLLEVHPQIEQKFTVFFWDLLQKRDEMPSADWRICSEMRDALKLWNLAKGIDQATTVLWEEELALFKNEFLRERDQWIENQMPTIQRISNKFEPLAKQLTESAMSITRMVVEEQNRERKVLMERLKYTRALEAQVIAKWRDLVKRLTHERAPWYFSENYPKSWELDPTEGPARIRIRMQRCHLDISERFFLPEFQHKTETVDKEAPLSYLFTSGVENANATALVERLHTSERIQKMSQVCVVTPQAEIPGEALIGETCFYFVPDSPSIPLHMDIALGGLDLAMAGGTAWKLEDIRELHRRRYQLQEKAVEIFLINGRTYLLAFNSSKERDDFVTELSNCHLPRRIPGDDLRDALNLWQNGTISNWEYIMCLNKLAGRSYNDLMQYPVFPFVLSDYVSEKIDLNDPKIYRNFKKPMAVQDKKNEQHYINNYNYLKQALSEGLNLIALNQEPFHYGSHYSNSGTVLHFLVRLPPFTSMFLNYQDDNFDIPDRTFHALATTWRLTSCDSTTDVKELIPEFFYLPEFLLNFEGFNFGVRQSGSPVGDVELPKWCGGDARIFVLAHRAALEADIVRENLPFWIDLVFGFRQTGKPAVEAINVFHPATYYGFNVEQIEDPLERQAWETMVRTYGQTPAQLFKVAHPLSIQNLVQTVPSTTPPVTEGVSSIKWGNYVGSPGNEPIVSWKHKHKTPLATLVPLATGDVFGLPKYTTLLLAYHKDKGASMLNTTAVLGASLGSWNSTDGIARLKTKKEQPPRPLVNSSGLDSISIMKSAPDCGQLWIGYHSGQIRVYSYIVTMTGKIEFSIASPTTLLGHRKRVTAVELSRAFSIAVSGDKEGILIIWDLNSLTYVRSVVQEPKNPINLIAVSETLGDIAVVHQIQSIPNDSPNITRSDLRVYTINTRPVGSIKSKKRITCLCYSNAIEGMSVNVIATGLENGLIRLWSSWDLRLVREIGNTSNVFGAVVAITWSCDQHHLYSASEDGSVVIWEGAKKLNSGTPKFLNLSPP